MRTGELSREYAMCQLMRASRTSNYITKMIDIFKIEVYMLYKNGEKLCLIVE